jgi:hypothetical protein
MSITLVQSKSTNQSSGGSLALAFNSSITSGNAIIVAVLCGSDPATPTISDGVNTYTALSEVSLTNSSSVSLRLFYALGVASGATTVTATAGSGNVLSIAIHEYSGIVGYDTSVSNTGATGNTQPAGSITTSVATELLFAATAVVISSGGMLAQNADSGDGFTKEQTSPSGSVVFSLWTQDKTVSSTGTYSFTSSVSFIKGGASQVFAVQLAGFRGPVDATVNATGISSTTAIGTTSETVAKTPSGISSTTHVGSLTVTGSANVTLTGVSSTSHVGVPTLPVRAIGIASTVLIGTATATGDANATGSITAVTTHVGTLTITGTVALTLTGVSSAVQVGIAVAQVKVFPAGVSSTSHIGAASIRLTKTPTGIQSTSHVGSLTILSSDVIHLVGIQVTCSVGFPLVECNSSFPMIAFLGM